MSLPGLEVVYADGGSIQVGEAEIVTAYAPPGKVAIAGGYHVSSGPNVIITRSAAAADMAGWTCIFRNVGTVPSGISARTFAVCVDA
jgi:hypothetical protein